MYVLQRSILQRWSIDRVPRMLRVCQSAQSSPAGRGCLSMVRACRSWTELADFKMNSRHGHVSQHHKADWRTRIVCIRSLSLTLASDMSVPRQHGSISSLQPLKLSLSLSPLPLPLSLSLSLSLSLLSLSLSLALLLPGLRGELSRPGARAPAFYGLLGRSESRMFVSTEMAEF